MENVGDISEFFSANYGPTCGVAKALESLEPELKEWIETAIGDNRALASKIARKLSELTGCRITANTMTRHRRGECRCRK